MTLDEQLQSYSFYHVIEVAPGVFTRGYRQLMGTQRPVLDAIRSLPLAGKRVLDIGCRDGLFCFEAERQGAEEIIGIDNDLSPAAVEFLIPHFKSKVRMHALNIMDLAPEQFGKFDLVIFAGVLYHLRYPFQALKQIRDVLRDGATLIIETGMYTLHEDQALLWCPTGTEGPYEPTSVTFFNIKGLTDTLRTFGITVQSHSYLDNHSIPHDRCTLICQFHEAKIDEELRRYWDGQHKLHTDAAEGPRVLATWGLVLNAER